MRLRRLAKLELELFILLGSAYLFSVLKANSLLFNSSFGRAVMLVVIPWVLTSMKFIFFNYGVEWSFNCSLMGSLNSSSGASSTSARGLFVVLTKEVSQSSLLALCINVFSLVFYFFLLQSDVIEKGSLDFACLFQTHSLLFAGLQNFPLFLRFRANY